MLIFLRGAVAVAQRAAPGGWTNAPLAHVMIVSLTNDPLVLLGDEGQRGELVSYANSLDEFPQVSTSVWSFIFPRISAVKRQIDDCLFRIQTCASADQVADITSEFRRTQRDKLFKILLDIEAAARAVGVLGFMDLGLITNDVFVCLVYRCAGEDLAALRWAERALSKCASAGKVFFFFFFLPKLPPS
jgi:hypothetical protein